MERVDSIHPRAPPELELKPKHTIFLSHSGEDKPFVEQLCVDLENAHYFPFFDGRTDSLSTGDPFPNLIKEAAKKCLAAVIVLSDGYMTSKWPIRELLIFVDATKTTSPNYNPNLRLVPLFYKKHPDDFKPKRNPDIVGARVADPQCKPWDELWEKLIRKHKNMTKQVTKELYDEAIEMVLSVTGPTMESCGRSEVKYRRKVVNEILKCVPVAWAIDTSTITEYDRMCTEISAMFKSDERDRKYLGLYGKPGLGKSIICCEALCQFFQEEFRGRICRVKLDNDKAGDGVAFDEGTAAAKKRFTRLTLAIEQLVGLPKSMSKVMSELGRQKFLTEQLEHRNQPVFLVVDNVSESSRDEAKWYAIEMAEKFPEKSMVLVTSRSRAHLEYVLGEFYCQPFPTLSEDEASKLFLSKATQGKASLTSLSDPEKQVLKECLNKCKIEEHIDKKPGSTETGNENLVQTFYIPRELAKLASFLLDRTKGDILRWNLYLPEVNSVPELEYDNLDDVSKLIFLDLAIFADGMRYTHMDFQDEWAEQSNFTPVVTFIAMLHGIPIHVAETKVKDLQGSVFSKSEKNEHVHVSDDYDDLALSVMKRASGKERKWCLLSMRAADDEDADSTDTLYEVSPEMVRVGLIGVTYDPDQHKIREWGNVKFVFLHAVQNLPVFDLRGLRSLRVLRVKECKGLKRIVCTCNTTYSDGLLCHQKKVRAGCLSELRVVQLECLPDLREASFTMHCRLLETLWFFDCPNLSWLPNLRYCKKLQRLRLPCGDFKDFEGLNSNPALTELAFQWDPRFIRNFSDEMKERLLADVMNLSNLAVLDTMDERKVYEWIPAGIRMDVSKLAAKMLFLDLSCASTVEEVAGLSLLSELTSLGLYGCWKLRRLPPLAETFPKLKRLCVGHCHSLNLTYPEDMPDELLEFHAMGATCCFGEHKCLDPEDPEKEGICSQCNEGLWGTLVERGTEALNELEQAPHEPGQHVEVRGLGEGSSTVSLFDRKDGAPTGDKSLNVQLLLALIQSNLEQNKVSLTEISAAIQTHLEHDQNNLDQNKRVMNTLSMVLLVISIFLQQVLR